jgi:hypothetical protein
MAEMMSEEISKVMDEQRNLEEEYASLVVARGQLKGISNKHKLEETKQNIRVSQALCNLNRESRTSSSSRRPSCATSCRTSLTWTATRKTSRTTRSS